ncbi:MAG: DsbA family protein [Alphaproteobacteria bacterium]
MKTQHISWLVAAMAAVALPAWAQDEPSADAEAVAEPAPSLLIIWPEDAVLGDPDAPVTIFEFSSLTCSHCAAFHVDILPEVKAELIESGMANLVVRHFPLDQLAMNAALVAECVPQGQFHSFIDVLYRTQESWVGSQNPMQAVLQTAMLAGVPEAGLSTCMQDQAVMNSVLAVRLRAQTELAIQSTPTFFVGGMMIRGAQPFHVFAEAVEVAAAVVAPPVETPESDAQDEPEAQAGPETAEPETETETTTE